MLTEICTELRNWFVRTEDDKHFGTFTISNGVFAPSFLVDGQYYRIVGSLFNDGVHKAGDTTETLTDETFDGAVWAMAIPPEVVSLSEEISTWYTANKTAAHTPYQSESFGGYTYSVGRGSWKVAFADRLNRWRKLNAS